MKELSEYDQQAISFLEKTNTTFKSEFLRFDSHFNNEDSKRNIFKITLSNTNGSYSFEFGNSIADSCEKIPEINTKPEHEVYCGIKILDTYISVKFNATVNELHREELPPIKLSKLNKEWQEQVSKVNKKVGNKYLTVNVPPLRNVLISALRSKRIKLYESKAYGDVQQKELVSPSEYDILACITKCDPYSFEDFCDNYGYDRDSRMGYSVYEAVVNEWENVSKLWSEDELEILSEIS